MTTRSVEHALKLEREAVDKLAEEYRAKGYEVWTGGIVPSLPEGLREQQFDLVARTNDGWIIVEIKRRAALRSDAQLKEMATRIAKVPGCRFELVVLEPIDDDVDNRPALPLETVKRLIETAELASRSGDYYAALLIRWSCLEAILRYLSQADLIQVEPWTTTGAVKTLYSEGQLDRGEYDTLTEAYRVRNAVAHGADVTYPIRDLTYELGCLTSKLLAAHEQRSAG